MQDKSHRRPVIDPIMLALKSRRVIVAVIALLVGVAALLAPELEPVRGELLTLLITLSLAVIGGYTVEDAAVAARNRDPQATEGDLRTLILEVVASLLDETHPPQE
jgi:hypothetical protein